MRARFGCSVFFVILTLLTAVGCAAKKKSAGQTMHDKASVRYSLAYDAYLRGELIQALAALMKAQEYSPKNGQIKNLLGLVYFRQEKFDKAEKMFLKAVELDPLLTEAYNNLGTLYFSREEYTKAKDALQKALEDPLYLHPERVYNNLGLVYLKLNKRDEARGAFERAMKLRRDFYLPYHNLGKLWEEQGNFKTAKGYFRDVIKLCDNCSESRYRLGKILLKEKQYKEALELFKKGAEVDPFGYYGDLCKKYIADAEK